MTAVAVCQHGEVACFTCTSDVANKATRDLTHTRELLLAREREVTDLRARLADAEKALAHTSYDATRAMLDRIALVDGVEFDTRCEENVADGVEALADHAKETEAERDAACAKADFLRAQVEAMREALKAIPINPDEDPDLDAIREAALSNTTAAPVADELAALRVVAEHLRYVLPMAKGYAAAHPVGSNAALVQSADDALARLDAARKVTP